MFVYAVKATCGICCFGQTLLTPTGTVTQRPGMGSKAWSCGTIVQADYLRSRFELSIVCLALSCEWIYAGVYLVAEALKGRPPAFNTKWNQALSTNDNLR
jgi:hypothetical protein